MERRAIQNKVELREADNGKTYIEGYGILFNTESQVLRTGTGQEFIETVAPEALKDTDMSDVIGRAEHTNAMLLGRTSSGTMELRVDEVGVYYRIEVPNTTAGRDTLEYIKRGDMRGASFAFPKPKDKVEKRDGMFYRTITSIDKLVDIGPVVNPAYVNTSATYDSVQRSIDAIEEELKETPIKKSGLPLDVKIKAAKLR